MRKMTSLLLAAGMTMALLSGCGGGTEAKETTAAQTTAAETKAEETTAAESKEAETKAAEVKAPEKDVEMQYMSVEDAHSNLGKDGYTFLDVRKAEDHKTSCVPGSVGVDMDAAKGGDFQAGVTAMQPIVDEHDDNLVIICYSGKSYAQATTNVLSALGYDMSKVYTLEGGYKAWTKAYADEVEVAQEIKAPEKDVEMQYMTVEEAAEKATPSLMSARLPTTLRVTFRELFPPIWMLLKRATSMPAFPPCRWRPAIWMIPWYWYATPVRDTPRLPPTCCLHWATT